jgi:arylformamidase
MGADTLPLHPFHGQATVIDVSDLDGDVPLDLVLVRCSGKTPTRLLLKTGRTIAAGSFPQRWPVLTPTCAAALVADGLILLGVDCPSVDDRDSKGLEIHHALFGGGAFVLENLDLRTVDPGCYELIAYPTKFVALDAAPVRAVLR